MMRPRHILMIVLAAGLVPAVGVQTARAQDEGQGGNALANLVIEVQQLRDEIRRLHGQLEDQQREIENLKRRQRDQYLDLDKRIQEAAQEGARAGDPAEPAQQPRQPRVADRPDGAGGSPEAGRDSAPERDDAPEAMPDRPEVREPVDASAEVTPLNRPQTEGARDLGTPTEAEQAAYDQAFRALREQRYADAAEGFDAFLAEYPNSSYAPNAQYWLGEAYYVTRDFATALDIFEGLLDQYPESSKAGDALLKVGYSHYELQSWTEARAALEQVRSRYPGTTLSRLAENRLRDLRMAGHY